MPRKLPSVPWKRLPLGHGAHSDYQDLKGLPVPSPQIPMNHSVPLCTFCATLEKRHPLPPGLLPCISCAVGFEGKGEAWKTQAGPLLPPPRACPTEPGYRIPFLTLGERSRDFLPPRKSSFDPPTDATPQSDGFPVRGPAASHPPPTPPLSLTAHSHQTRAAPGARERHLLCPARVA